MNQATKFAWITRQITKPSLMNAFTKKMLCFHFISCYFFVVGFRSNYSPWFHRNSSHFIWIFLCSRAHQPTNAWCIIMRNYVMLIKYANNTKNQLNEYASRATPSKEEEKKTPLRSYVNEGIVCFWHIKTFCPQSCNEPNQCASERARAKSNRRTDNQCRNK